MKLNYVLTIQKDGQYSGKLLIKNMNIGMKDVGKFPEYSLIDMELTLTSPSSAEELTGAINNLDINWIRSIFDNVILIDKTEEHLFEGLDFKIIKAFTLDNVNYTDLGKMILMLIQSRVDVYKCTVESVSLISK